MRKLWFLFFNALLIFNLGSCTGNRGGSDSDAGNDVIDGINSTDAEKLSPGQRKVIKANCVVNRFRPGYEKDLYGRDCIENKHLFIQTSEDGKPVATSVSLSSDPNRGADGLRTEKNPGFITDFYDLEYAILKDEGRDKKFPFLREDFLIKQKQDAEEKFYGSKNTKYKVVFKTEGNYLILYKASKNLEDIPHTERPIIPRDKKGNYVKEDGYYMVPFVGYQVEYCRAKTFRDAATNKKHYDHYPECKPEWANYDPKKQTPEQRAEDEKEGLKSTVYLRIFRNPRTEFVYHPKQDLFPADYFDGEWFFSEGEIESYEKEGEISPSSVKLVTIRNLTEKIEFVDNSGVVKEERHKNIYGELPVTWVDYEMNQDGGVFNKFGERLNPSNSKNPTIRPYVMIDFQKIKNEKNAELVDLLVTPDYFSYVLSLPVTFKTKNPNTGKESTFHKKIKHKYSLLRKKFVSEEGFKVRKWFKNDMESYFGVFPTFPQQEKTVGDTTEGDLYKHSRMMRFHTDRKETVIRWYFSKNSTADPFYLEIAREAMSIFNQAFQMLTKGTDKSIKVVLDETERKDLGDLRYNVMNLFKTEEIGHIGLHRDGVVFGYAPSYVNPVTGQIIGATANIILPTLLEESFQKVKSYTRYEVFQKNKKTDEENKIHVVESYLRERIQKQCTDLTNFIKEKVKKYSEGEITPETELKDKDLLLSCSEKVYRVNVLHLMLHEMGHNFGLIHNFKGSVDKDNYYESIAEIKQYFPNLSDWLVKHLDSLEQFSGGQRKLFKTSSVMDYLPIMSAFALPVLGKYDLAALRFLYMNQLEDKDKYGEYIDLNIPDNLDEQKPLSGTILSQRKNYLYCPDWIAKNYRMSSSENFLCVSRDYGANPLEITKNYMQEYQRLFNSFRYRYDDKGFFLLPFLLAGKLNAISPFLMRLDQIRSFHFKKRSVENVFRYSLSDHSTVDDYEFQLAKNIGISSEHDSFYEARKPIFDFLINVLFTETMKCEVRDSSTNQKYVIDLELIRTQFYPDYMEDCYSESVKLFLANQNLELVNQRGVENLANASYHFIESSGKGERSNIWTLAEIQQLNFLNKPTMLARVTQLVAMMFGFLYEVDYLEKIKVNLEERILEGETLSAGDLNFINAVYRAFKQVVQAANRGDDNQSIQLSNKRYFQSVEFKKGTQSDRSFYQGVELPLSEGRRTVEQLEQPFIAWAYKQREKEGSDASLEDYIVSLSSTIDYGDSFAIPFQRGFMEKVMAKYNKNKERIAVLKKKTERNFLEAIELKRKLTYNDFLLKIVKGER